MDQVRYEGGCLCGNLRYVATRPPVDAGYCHCRLCQRSTGAPVLAWASFRSDAFTWLAGEPSVFHSSERGLRDFCGNCGTQILFREPGSPTLDVNLGSLDDPAAIEPQYHSFIESRIPWFDTADDLPRHTGAGPDGEKR